MCVLLFTHQKGSPWTAVGPAFWSFFLCLKTWITVQILFKSFQNISVIYDLSFIFTRRSNALESQSFLLKSLIAQSSSVTSCNCLWSVGGRRGGRERGKESWSAWVYLSSEEAESQRRPAIKCGPCVRRRWKSTAALSSGWVQQPSLIELSGNTVGFVGDSLTLSSSWTQFKDTKH